MKKLSELGISTAPWRSSGICAVDDGRVRPVAEVYPFSPMSSKMIANRKLVSAALDLYEAARLCLGEMCKYCKEHADRPCVEMCETARMARTAIEKAGGAE